MCYKNKIKIKIRTIRSSLTNQLSLKLKPCLDITTGHVNRYVTGHVTGHVTGVLFSRFFDRNTGTNNALAAGNDVAAQSLQKEKQ